MKGRKWFAIIGTILLVFSLVFISFFYGLVKSDPEILRLHEEIQQKNNENQKLLKQIQELKTQLLNRQIEVDQLQEEKEQLNQDVDEKEKEIKELKKQIEILKKESTKKEQTVSPQKKVYLTFDDGPTTLTPNIIDTLQKYNVQATFFVIGKRLEQYPQYSIQAYKNGNMILPHSYSHDYAIYTTHETFYADYDKVKKAYQKTLGFEPPPIFRFPGGSSNHSSFQYGGIQYMPLLTQDIKKKGYFYIDWNVTSGDAGADYQNAQKLLDNVLTQSKGKDVLVVLFHDVSSNTATAEILPKVIEHFKKEGYQFQTFRDITQKDLNQLVALKISNKPIVR